MNPKSKETINKFFNYFDNNNKYNNLIKLFKKTKNISVLSNNNSIKSLFLTAFAKDINSKLLIITKNYFEQQNWVDDLNFFSNDIDIIPISQSPKGKKEYLKNPEALGWIVQGLETFSSSDKAIMIATPEELTTPLPNKLRVEDSRISIAKGQKLNFDQFVQELLLNGFSRTDFVASEGDIALRGGIIDIFPFGKNNPLRLEFFGDEIESIREFEIISQRSIKEHSEITFFNNIFNISTINTPVSIFEYLQKSDLILVIDEPEMLEIEPEIEEKIKEFPTIFINPLEKADFEILVEKQPSFEGSIKEFTKKLLELEELGTNIIITADNQDYLIRLQNLVQNYFDQLSNQQEDNSTFSSIKIDNIQKQFISKIQWIDNPISNGFITKNYKYAIFTEHQIFERLKRFAGNRNNDKPSLSLKELETLNIGDYIVHSDKGIAEFDGIQTIKIGNSMQDCIRLKFQDDDILYLNLNYINKIDRYYSSEGIVPKLSKLGSPDWDRRKQRLKKKIKDLSRDLISLYAKRKSSVGHQFPADNLWQKEFEASFMFEDTIDQSKTSEEVKQDMSSKSPMDRLVCGDVGFGKTEIAIRAAFKAAINGKQAAVLVPTTILAQQHYMTFQDRMNKYPIVVEVLSRFKSKKEQEEVLKQLKDGKIDIIIGTHRLLSNDVQFKDLGLLIIDEEHRFGVAAKEKLRKMRENIDTLTMTATPIPRTLNFSLLGVRDISVIETPPPNRLPVYTEIINWDKSAIRDAFTKELSRHGQIFFVSDKVYDLELITQELRTIIPNARFGIAHGQMNTAHLEKIMEEFLERKYDVLVTTKIIESGLDIPNANTIFINRAQNFGLAELYQLRGRVGRSNKQAYCYLIVPNDHKLPERSLKRLQALEEFTDLGSGLKLAMRDMELRGVGNLFGAEQSGYISDLGYELYSRVLDEAVQELKEEEFSELFAEQNHSQKKLLKNDNIEIDYDQNAFFPNDYVPSETERYAFYKRLYQAKTPQEINDLENEAIDRFGKLPIEAENLFFIIRMRVLALETGFLKLQIKSNTLTIELPENNSEYYQEIFPTLIDYVSMFDDIQFVQNKNKLNLVSKFQDNQEMLEFLWKLKKNLTENFT
ncbi:MAG TPA: transcription-repair coupling factor [Bacteroidetes bacterium]|nr:transcription-repair coupling factor [Bacteroidota bacterium]